MTATKEEQTEPVPMTLAEARVMEEAVMRLPIAMADPKFLAAQSLLKKARDAFRKDQTT